MVVIVCRSATAFNAKLDANIKQQPCATTNKQKQAIKQANKQTAWVTREYLVEWIRNNELLEIVFTSSYTHTQLIQRSKDIITFLLKEKQLEIHDLDTIWKSTIGEPKDRLICVYKLIQSFAFLLTSEQKMRIMVLFEQMEPSDVIEETIKFIKEMAKFVFYFILFFSDFD